MEENFEKQEQGAQENASAADFVSSYGGQNPVPPMEEKPINMITGIVGAFVGVLIGVVLWVVIYQMGFIAGIAGFVMMICAFKGFELLGGRMNIVGAVICILLVLVAVYFAHNISVAVEVMQELDISFVAAYQSIPDLREVSSEFNEGYLHDLLFGYLLTLLAVVPSFKRKRRE